LLLLVLCRACRLGVRQTALLASVTFDTPEQDLQTFQVRALLGRLLAQPRAADLCACYALREPDAAQCGAEHCVLPSRRGTVARAELTGSPAPPTCLTFWPRLVASGGGHS
jgi:hypothetical protein